MEAEPDAALKVGQAYVILWNDGGLKWYLGYCLKVLDNDLFKVEHLQRCKTADNLKWKYPSKSDIQTVAPEQVLECSVLGEWNILSNRTSEFILRNHELIEKQFSELVKSIA